MCLQFGFVIFWQKDFGAKAAHKMLVKLTLGLKGMPSTGAQRILGPFVIRKKMKYCENGPCGQYY
jgi:hypothetical protein